MYVTVSDFYVHHRRKGIKQNTLGHFKYDFTTRWIC